MPLLRINASEQGLKLHGSAQPIGSAFAQLHRSGLGRHGTVIMVHGYKYSPFVVGRSPHKRILAAQGWPAALHLSHDRLHIAFGWHARGGLRGAYDTALEQSAQLAQLIRLLRTRGPVHIIAHSLGATLVLAALPYLQADDVGRIVLLSGAAHIGLARHALATPAGERSTLFHVTGRENALFDRAFEQMIAGSGAIGRGLATPQAMRLHIDCADTRAALTGLGYPLARPKRRVCHWSSYTRGGVMDLNAALLGGALTIAQLRGALPAIACAAPSLTTRAKACIMHPLGVGKRSGHAHA